jgi:hypothetical protein
VVKHIVTAVEQPLVYTDRAMTQTSEANAAEQLALTAGLAPAFPQPFVDPATVQRIATGVEMAERTSRPRAGGRARAPLDRDSLDREPFDREIGSARGAAPVPAPAPVPARPRPAVSGPYDQDRGDGFGSREPAGRHRDQPVFPAKQQDAAPRREQQPGDPAGAPVAKVVGAAVNVPPKLSAPADDHDDPDLTALAAAVFGPRADRPTHG